MKKILTTIFLIATAVTVLAQVNVEARLDSTEVLIGSQAHLQISVTAPKGSTVNFPYYSANQQMSGGLEVVTADREKEEQGNNLEKTVNTYTITAWEARKYDVPAMKVRVNGKEYPTKSIPLTVQSTKVDTTARATPFPPSDVMDNSFSWAEIIPLILLLLLVLGLCIAAVYLRGILRRNKPIAIFSKTEKKILPHEKAMQEIEKINRTTGNDQKAYYTSLTNILRQYLEDRFGIMAMEMTSSEIIDRLRAEDSREKLNELREVFQTADLVKFAKHSTLRNEEELYLTNVVQFIQETKLEAQPEAQQSAPQLTAEEQQSRRTRLLLKSGIALLVASAVGILIYIGISVYDLIV